MINSLYNHWDINVRLEVASNTNTSPKILDLLSEDKMSVRRMVAYNPNTTSKTLEKLIHSNENEIAIIVAIRTDLSLDMMRLLIEKDFDPSVKETLLENNTVPNEILKTLCKDSNENVSFAAKNHPNFKLKMLL